jgi:hypothetical protein
MGEFGLMSMLDTKIDGIYYWIVSSCGFPWDWQGYDGVYAKNLAARFFRICLLRRMLIFRISTVSVSIWRTNSSMYLLFREGVPVGVLLCWPSVGSSSNL